MTEWCWLNGHVMPLDEARVSVEDRGFQFADGVYEAVRLYDGRPFELPVHLARLERSCGGIRLPMPIESKLLASEMTKLVAHSGVRDGSVYLQITRGVSRRNHIFPRDVPPTALFYIRALPPLPQIDCGKPYALLSVPDERWNKCWIKCIGLIENVLAKNTAADAGADEAIFIHNGNVTEGSASNIFMIAGGKLITHPLGPKVLPGVTREILLRCAASAKIPVEERAMTLDEAQCADEIFITSSTRELVWVNRWDNQPVGGGSCGKVTMQLHAEYRRCVREMITRT